MTGCLGRKSTKGPLLAAVALIILAQGGCGMLRRDIPVAASRVEFDEVDRRLVWPLPISTTARVTSRFGNRKDPLTGLQNFHTGVDLDGAIGTPVHASGQGTVSFAGFRRGYGNLLIIDHGNGLTTWYGHCSVIIVSNGAHVYRGRIVARVGNTGRTSGPHLHFETRKHGRPFDPFQLLPSLRIL